jgi:hypothetical protein
MHSYGCTTNKLLAFTSRKQSAFLAVEVSCWGPYANNIFGTTFNVQRSILSPVSTFTVQPVRLAKCVSCISKDL